MLFLVGNAVGQDNACLLYISQVEQAAGIPDNLLAAIAKVESGKWNTPNKRLEPWPWAVQAEGKGYYFNSKEEAIRAIKQLQLKGVRNIDVGCMQVNLGHHGHNFASIEDALDPSKNVGFAGQHLKKLHKASSSWTQAISHYHSATPIRHIPYRNKVYNAWVGDSIVTADFKKHTIPKIIPAVHKIRTVRRTRPNYKIHRYGQLNHRQDRLSNVESHFASHRSSINMPDTLAKAARR